MTVFDDPAYKTAFQQFRRMRPDMFDRYLACLERPDIPDGQALDVGCGPGLQAEMLLERLPAPWTLTALESSLDMAAAARQWLSRFGARFSVRESRLEDLPDELNPSFDVAWLSEVAHLLGNAAQWTARLGSLMKPGGRILIRTSTHAQLKEREWYQFFPSALPVDLARHPDREALNKALSLAGFNHIVTTTIDESRPIEKDFFYSMMQNKAFSTLHDIEPNAFEEGLRLLRTHLIGKSEVKWCYEMTAYTATFVGGPIEHY